MLKTVIGHSGCPKRIAVEVSSWEAVLHLHYRPVMGKSMNAKNNPAANAPTWPLLLWPIRSSDNDQRPGPATPRQFKNIVTYRFIGSRGDSREAPVGHVKTVWTPI